MRLTLERQVEIGWSMLGWLSCRGRASVLGASIERRWTGNTAWLSCVPAGFYVLERHDGPKYSGTWALIGDRVAHAETPGIPRSACVLHWAATGEHLAGCVSLASELRVPSADHAFGVGNRIPELLAELGREPGPHFLTIHDPPGRSSE